MWKILIFLLVGMFIGSTFKMTDKMKLINGKLQHLGVVLLLFTMGASIGLDRNLLRNLQILGLKAAVFAILTSIFSIIIVYVSIRLLTKGEQA